MTAAELSTVCVRLAVTCVIFAAISMAVSWYLASKGPAKTAVDAANNLAQHPGLVPTPADVSKVLDSAKGLIDSLSKASPLVVWLAAAVFFMALAAFDVSDYGHGTLVPGQSHPSGDPNKPCPQNADPKKPCPPVVKK